MSYEPCFLQEEWFPTDYGWNSGTWGPVAGDNETRETRDAFVQKSRENHFGMGSRSGMLKRTQARKEP